MVVGMVAVGIMKVGIMKVGMMVVDKVEVRAVTVLEMFGDGEWRSGGEGDGGDSGDEGDGGDGPGGDRGFLPGGPWRSRGEGDGGDSGDEGDGGDGPGGGRGRGGGGDVKRGVSKEIEVGERQAVIAPQLGLVMMAMSSYDMDHPSHPAMDGEGCGTHRLPHRRCFWGHSNRGLLHRDI